VVFYIQGKQLVRGKNEERYDLDRPRKLQGKSKQIIRHKRFEKGKLGA
jgi:hypothetical protein